MVKRIMIYGTAEGWITGQGDSGVTSIFPLIPIMTDMMVLNLTSIEDMASSFQAHDLASYMLLIGRVKGGFNNTELNIMKTLVNNAPTNPFYLAILHRFTDGVQSGAIDALNKMPEVDSPTGWGSSSWQVIFTVTVGIMEGR